MVKRVNEGLIIILDVGKNVAQTESKQGKRFFDEAKELTARIIERKILSQGKDYLGIILMGSNKTLNNMAEQCEGGFRNIETLFKMQPPLWSAIRDLPQETTKKSSDWVEALTVAADHVQNEVSGVNILKMKIILITNFLKKTHSEKHMDMVLNGLKESKYEINIFGPDICDEESNIPDYDMAREFVQQTNGETGTFQEIMQYLRFHKKKAVRPRPENMDLNIGSNIKIPVTTYGRIRDIKIIERWGESILDPATSKTSTKEFVEKKTIYYNADDQTLVKECDAIKVYNIGHQIIPVSAFDQTMLYETGPKSLSLYGFTYASNIHWQHLNGNGLSYIFARKEDNKAQQAITCLVKHLHEKKMVGIVRYVYHERYGPKMCVLMPVIDTSNYMCLSMTSLCYKEAIKYMLFPATPATKYLCTTDQVDAMKNLILAMDLTKAYDETFDGTEAFPTGEIISPHAQYTLDCIVHRAMHPSQPLPPPRDDILNLFKIPPAVEEKSYKPLLKIKSLFMLKKVEERIVKRRKKLLNIADVDEVMTSAKNENEDVDQKIALPSTSASNQEFAIGTINPVKDFSGLLSEGKTLAELAPEMTDVIESLLYYNLDGTYTKALAAMTHFRNECLKSDPSQYNNWLHKFKVDLTNRNRQDLQTLIKDKRVDFILKSENSHSLFETVKSHEESQLYEIDTVPESTEMLIDPDIDAMFDDM